PPTPLLLSCPFQRSRSHRDLHSFPTRRSSDLHMADIARAKPAIAEGLGIGLGIVVVARKHGWANYADLASFAIRHFPTLFVLNGDRKSTRLNSSHVKISYAVFCLKKKTKMCT